ncbi:MAG TPA: hypothetical protein DCW51_10640, partial [Clostridium sp.]|nr:hypothetical protein [Clostridium sp.]
MYKNEIVVSSTNLIQVQKSKKQSSLALGLLQDEDATRFKNILKLIESKHVYAYISSIDLIDCTFELIEKYEYQLNWTFLSINENLSWSIALIEKYKDR